MVKLLTIFQMEKVLLPAEAKKELLSTKVALLMVNIMVKAS